MVAGFSASDMASQGGRGANGLHSQPATSLPPPPPAGLQGLDISGNDAIESLAPLRAALAEARELKHLTASACLAKGLKPADVDWLLAACPRLMEVEFQSSYGLAISGSEPELAPDCQAVVARLQAALKERRAAALEPAGPPAAAAGEAP